MSLPHRAQSICALLLFTGGLFGQTVSSSLVGTVLDPSSAVVPNAAVTATDEETGATRASVTDSSGVFRFLNLTPGQYSVSVTVTGFKALSLKQIALAAQETRDVGRLTLTLGATTDTIAITAEATPIQLASSEKSQAIDGRQLNDITLKGRDVFGYLKLVPGVIDTVGNRDVASASAINGIFINGNNNTQKNFTVDGITDMDTGSNTTLHFEPNMDAIQELKVLTSNYQAEFGRNGGGTITVVTKNGTKDFHGTAAWNHRHEGFNANLWQNNRNGRNAQNVPISQISPYRFNVETYSIGGPVFIPKVFNTQKNRLFFFWSQEYTGQFVSGGIQNKYTPTALERAGDFSESRQNNGALITITDPTTGSPFPNNRIPTNRIDPTGLAMLNYFPLPNFTGTGSQANVVNYTESASATHPRRNDVLRIDTYLTSKITGYVRYINDHDDLIALYQGVQFTKGTGGVLGDAGVAPVDHPNPGHGYSGTMTYSISPTLINEFTVGKSWNTWSYYSLDDYKSIDRSLVKNPATLFALPTTNLPGVSVTNGYQNLMPQFSYGGPPNNSMSFTKNSTSAGAYENFNTIWAFTDNLSKVVGKHTLKTGFYIERNVKIQPAGGGYSGNYNFGPDSLNGVNNTGNGYANGLLGYVNSYSQQTARAVFNDIYWNYEAYIQDNWRINRRLTLDVGVRFYHQTPQVDTNNTFSNFVPSLYKQSALPRIYIPGTSAGKRVALDPLNNTVAPVAYIGLFVPNTGNPATGMLLHGANGNPLEPYHQRPVVAAPRVGFAYDLTGDGKTALRGGFGIFYNRLDGNQVYALSGQAPFAYTPTVSYTTFGQIAASGNNLVIGPSGPQMWPLDKNVPWDRVQNASMNIQRSIGGGTVIDVGYTGNWAYNQNLTTNLNPIPMGTRAPFNPKNADATNGNKTLADIFLRTVYPGYNGINGHMLIGHTNYHALTTSVQRRFSHGLAWGLAYTFSKSMGTTAYNPVVPDNEKWNYGFLSNDRTHNLQVNYSYKLPEAGKALHSKVLGAFTDNWTLSGIFSMQSGAPFNPGGPNVNGTAPDYTGTPDVGARVNVVGDPMKDVPAGLYYNPNAFAPPVLGSTITTPVLGNLGGGAGVMRLPRVTNLDATMAKFIPIRERVGFRLQFQAYNVLNHTEYNGVGTGLQWDATGKQTSVSAGVFNSTLPARILAFSARFEF
ncbi:MAG: TonB-dependent receptor [Candidatus Solibacter sp.]